jgi:hypothetical protein
MSDVYNLKWYEVGVSEEEFEAIVLWAKETQAVTVEGEEVEA